VVTRNHAVFRPRTRPEGTHRRCQTPRAVRTRYRAPDGRACNGRLQAGPTGSDRRVRCDALEGAESRALARPPVPDESGRPGALEQEPLDDRFPRLARLARADAGA